MGKISQYNDVPVPKLSDMLIGTSVGLNEQDQVENQTYNFTLQQLLDLFVPNIPSNNLQGVLDNGNTATQDINLFGKITTDDLEVTNDATFNNAYLLGNTYIQGLLFDETYESGVDGQVLSRSDTGVKWVTLPPIFTPNLQQVLNVGNIASTDIQLSATLFADVVESDDITSNTSLTVNGELVDGDGSSGLNNQVLTSTGAGKVEWKDQTTYSGVAPISVDNGTKQISISQAGPTTNGYLSSTDWNAFDSKQDGLFGTGIVKSTAGVITYITDNSADWNSAYNDTIVSAGVAGTTTKTLTLTQRDGGIITASWSEIDTAPVTSVFGRTGDVVAQTGDYTTTQVTEGTNLYYLDSRARAAISLTTTGSSGPATYNSSTGVLNIPDYGGGLTGYVPYTGATSNVNLGEHGITSGYVAFDLTPTGTPTGVSTMYWDTAYRTVSLIDGDGDTTLQIGQEERVLVHNNTGSALTDGQVVYITGSTGNLPSVALASASSESNSAVTIGVVTETIPNGTDGFITVSGIVNGLNTLAFTEGDMLWLGVTPGTFTNVKPISPNHLVLIGYVVKRAGGNGSILVKIQNTQELNECSDVLFDIPEVDGQVLSLQTVSGTQLWRNRTIPSILGYTPISLVSLSASSPLSYNNTTGAFSIQQANGSQNGFLSSTDWNTFNNKQAAGNYITSLTGEATATGPGAASVTLINSAVTGKVLTGVNITGGSINDTDSILTAFGKVQNQINGLVGGSIYQGTWNASTNTPSLASGVGTKGYYYIVSVAGSTNLDGITDWNVGDWAIFDGTAWQQVDNTDSVVSVNGFTGAVSLTTANIPEASNLYYTDARARAALSFTAGSGAYNSTTGVITIPTNTNQLTNGANFITLSSLNASSPLSYNNGTGAFSITQANSTTNGFLSSTDWNTFNNKQNALVSGTNIKTINGNSILGSGDLSISGSQWITSGSNIYYNTGNVGIGTSNPTRSFVVQNSTTDFGPTAIFSNTSSANGSVAGIRMNPDNTSDGLYIGIHPTGFNIPNLAFINQEKNAPLAIYTNGSERMRITSSGNVGIGTTSPSSLLTVNGTTQITSGSIQLGNGLQFYFSSNIGYITSFNAGVDWRDLDINSKNTIFRTLDSERMRITSGGNVGIGTTSPASKLHVSGDIAMSYGSSLRAANYTYSKVIEATWNGSYDVVNIYTAGDGAINSSPKVTIYSDGRVNVSGSITASGGFFNSDIRLKEITDYEYSVSDIKPITYTWKDKRDNKKHIGYSAQEVQKVMPDAVNEDAEGMLSVNYVEILVAQIDFLNKRILELEKIISK